METKRTESFDISLISNLELYNRKYKDHYIIMRKDYEDYNRAFCPRSWMVVPNRIIDFDEETSLKEGLDTDSNDFVAYIRGCYNEMLSEEDSPAPRQKVLKCFTVDGDKFFITDDKKIFGIVTIDEEKHKVWAEYTDEIIKTNDLLKSNITRDFGYWRNPQETMMKKIHSLYKRLFKIA